MIPDSWSFDAATVAENFDDHVREQLPWYDLVLSSIAHIAYHYIPRNGLVYDLGCATGNVSAALSPIAKARNAETVGIDLSPKMAALYAERFGKEFPRTQADVHDIATYNYEPFDVAVSMLTLCFLPPQDVAPLLHRLCSTLNPGGAIVLVEKFTTPGGYGATVLSRMTLAQKIANAVPAQEVVAKELSLRGVQRPLDPRVLSDFKGYGFFRFGEFVGYVIEGRRADR